MIRNRTKHTTPGFISLKIEILFRKFTCYHAASKYPMGLEPTSPTRNLLALYIKPRIPNACCKYDDN
jgi:hypothetical protein